MELGHDLISTLYAFSLICDVLLMLMKWVGTLAADDKSGVWGNAFSISAAPHSGNELAHDVN